MLIVYREFVEALGEMRELLEGIERRDRDLARQLRRAAASVALNVAEGSGNRGGSKRLRYSTALGSLRETRACVDVAVALGYVRVPNAVLMRKLDRVGGALYRLAR